MKYTKLLYNEVILELPHFLSYEWPHDIAFEKFPSYCGPGRAGDSLIPDTICGVNIAPACFVHDVDWLVCDGTWLDFQKANNRFLRNLTSIINTKVPLYMRPVAYAKALLFWACVSSLLGWRNYIPVKFEEGYPLKNQVIQDKIKELNRGRNV
jgi:hypothetical protein